MTYPTCDNDCTRMGWIELIADYGEGDLHVSIAPETCLDDTFKAFCHDEQEMIWMNGWLFDWQQIEDDDNA